eukprot:2669631-Pyramimonas_sp.AAC.1
MVVDPRRSPATAPATSGSQSPRMPGVPQCEVRQWNEQRSPAEQLETAEGCRPAWAEPSLAWPSRA